MINNFFANRREQKRTWLLILLNSTDLTASWAEGKRRKATGFSRRALSRSLRLAFSFSSLFTLRWRCALCCWESDCWRRSYGIEMTNEIQNVPFWLQFRYELVLYYCQFNIPRQWCNLKHDSSESWQFRSNCGFRAGKGMLIKWWKLHIFPDTALHHFVNLSQRSVSTLKAKITLKQFTFIVVKSGREPGHSLCAIFKFENVR